MAKHTRSKRGKKDGCWLLNLPCEFNYYKYEFPHGPYRCLAMPLLSLLKGRCERLVVPEDFWATRVKPLPQSFANFPVVGKDGAGVMQFCRTRTRGAPSGARRQYGQCRLPCALSTGLCLFPQSHCTRQRWQRHLARIG